MALDRSPDLPSFDDVITTDLPNDIHGHSTVYHYNGDEGLVAGMTLNVTFTVAHPLSVSWPVIKDWNAWHSQAGLYYSAVVGDLAKGDRFSISLDPNSGVIGEADEYSYEILRVVPGHVIAIDQPIPQVPEIGLGKVPAGCHFMYLEENDGVTKVSQVMQHESLMALTADVDDALIEKSAQEWKDIVEEGSTRWFEDFVPVVRRLVDESV